MKPELAKNLITVAPKRIFGEFSLLSFNKYWTNKPDAQINNAKNESTFQILSWINSGTIKFCNK